MLAPVARIAIDLQIVSPRLHEFVEYGDDLSAESVPGRQKNLGSAIKTHRFQLADAPGHGGAASPPADGQTTGRGGLVIY